MSLYSERDLPPKTREGIRMVVLHGHAISRAARKAGVSRKSLSLAVRKIDAADLVIRGAYVVVN